MEDNFSSFVRLKGSPKVLSDEEILLRFYNNLRSGSSVDESFYRMKNDNSLVIANWISASLNCSQFEHILANESFRASSLLAVFKENYNDNLLSLSAFLIAYGEQYTYFIQEIEKYISKKGHNSLTYSQAEYLIDKILQLKYYDRIIELSEFNFRNVKMEEIGLDEDLISFPFLLIKILMKKIMNNSFFIEASLIKKDDDKRKIPKRSYKKSKKSSLGSFSKSDVRCNSWNKSFLMSADKSDDRRDDFITLMRSLKTSKSFKQSVPDTKLIKINTYFYERLERILHSTTQVKGNSEINPEYLQVILDDPEFCLLLSYLKKEHLEKIILPIPTNFTKFYSRQFFNVAFYIIDQLDAQYVQMLYNDEIHEVILESFQCKENEMFIDYEIKIFIAKFFIRNFSIESSKLLMKYIEETVLYKLRPFIFHSCNSHIRIVLTAEIFSIISNRFGNVRVLSQKLITDLSNIFNNIISSTDISISRPSLLERDFEERCVFDIIMENNLLDFLTSDVVKSIIIEEWNENMNSVHSTNLLNSNNFLFHAVKTQFTIPNHSLIPLFQDAITQSKNHSKEKQFYFQFYKWKGNIQHKFLFESFGYFIYFILMFVLFLANLGSFSIIGQELKKLSNDNVYSFQNLTDPGTFTKELNAFLVNTRNLYMLSLILYAIFSEYINKFAFSIRTGCKFSRLILNSWTFDGLILAILLIKDIDYLAIRNNMVCLLDPKFTFGFNYSDASMSFTDYMAKSNLSLNETMRGKYLCEFYDNKSKQIIESQILMNQTNKDIGVYFNLAYESKENIFMLLNHMFFIYRMIGISASAFLLKLLFYFKLNPTIGPFLEIIRYIVLHFLSFCFLLLLIVFIATVFVNCCFFDVTYTFTSFFGSFVGLWEVLIGARTGSDYFTDLSEVHLKFVDYMTITHLGRLFILIFTMLTTVLILNLTIAMISTSYIQYYRASKAIYCKDIIKFKNTHIYSNIYDCLIRVTFPFNIFVLPFLFLFLLVKNIYFIKNLNKIFNLFYFTPYLLGYLIFFILSNIFYYVINMVLLLVLAVWGIMKCTVTIDKLYFFAIYIFMGMYFIITDTVTYLRISFIKPKRNLLIKKNAFTHESSLSLKEAENRLANKKESLISNYHFYVSSFQHSEKDEAMLILSLEDIYYILSFSETYMGQKIQFGYLIHGLCSKYTHRLDDSDSPRIRRNNLVSVEKGNSNTYSKFRELLSFFDVYKDGYIDCKAVYYSLQSLLNNFLFKNILKELNKRDYMTKKFQSQTETIIEKDTITLPQCNYPVDKGNFIILLEKSTEVNFNFIGRDILMTSIAQNSIINSTSYRIFPDRQYNADDDNEPESARYEAMSTIKSVSRNPQGQGMIEEIPEGSLSEINQNNNSQYSGNSNDRILCLERKIAKMEEMMNEMLGLLKNKSKNESYISNGDK